MSLVYLLHVEDASHLGGPMGTEYTSTIEIKAFRTLDEAKEYAVKKFPFSKMSSKKKEVTWERIGDEWAVDVGPYIFSIEKQEY